VVPGSCSDYPPADDDIFEWIDVLESVAEAQGSYTMMELGAGYGCWSVRAATACRILHPDISVRLVLVEPEPTHFEWISEHFRDNGLDPSAQTLIQAALSDAPGERLFYTRRLGKDSSAADWYGQALAEEPPIDSEAYDATMVQCVTLSDVLSQMPFGTIDLVDMDLQGQEEIVIRSAIEQLTQRAKRLHIGTHSRAIEAGLQSILNAHGWRCLIDYPCMRQHDTPYGLIRFVDGVQTWVNPLVL
jgi:FkbM family methyltransferase